MTISLTNAANNARQDGLVAHIGNGAKLRIYSGTAPANIDAALSGNTLLGELTCGTPFAPAAAGNGVITANAITQDSAADNSGTASFYRIYKADGTTPVLQGSVTGTGGGGDLELNTTNIVAGGPIAVSSWTLTDGN